MEKRREQLLEDGRQLWTVGLVLCILLAVIVLATSASAVSASLGGLIVTDVNVTVGLDNTAEDGANSQEPIIAGTVNNSEGTQTARKSIKFSEIEENILFDYDIHFVVETDKPSYWRLTAYNSYQIDGWAKTASSPVHETPPREEEREILSHKVILKSDAMTVPSAYRPISVVRSPDINRTFGGESGIHLEEAAEPGDTFLLTSIRPTTNATKLQQAETDYDDEIKQRYTVLPDNISEVVNQQTARIVNSEDSPYGKAVAIESWFRQNYNYTVDASPPDGEVTAELLMNRTTADSKYFATAMTVMLRSEGVPARLAVGYTAGEPDPNNGAYIVRGLHTHSWVEVYFPEYGWVPFDPTPPDERAQKLSEMIDNESASDLFTKTDSTDLAERNTEAVADARAETQQGEQSEEEQGEQSEEEQGEQSEEEQGEQSEEEQSEQSEEEQSEQSEEGSEGDRGNQSSLHQFILLDDPIPGTEVPVQLKYKGVVVPDAVIEVSDTVSGRTNESGIYTFEVPFQENLTISGYNVSTDESLGIVASNSPSATIEEELPTNLTVSVDGPVRPESETTTEVLIEGVPVENADVRIDGALIDRTGENGTVTHPIPDISKDVTIVAKRGAATGKKTVPLADIAVSVDAWPTVLPGVDATATVTYVDSTPVSNVTIATDGEIVGTTNENGTLTLSPGFRMSETVTATRGDMSASVKISPILNLLIGLAGFTLLVMVLGLSTRLAGISPTGLGRSAAATTAHFLVIAVIQLSRLIDRLWKSIHRGTGSPMKWIVTKSDRFTSDSRDDTRSQNHDQAFENPGPIRNAWLRLVSLAPISRPETRTPGEIAEVAKRSGFPRRAVDTILEAFRVVQYADREPEQYTEEDVETAANSLEDD